MAVSLVARLAASAPAPVFALVGEGGRAHARALLLEPRLQVVSSPRHATVLLVLGTVPVALHAAARRMHDQLPHPRGTVVLPLEDGQDGQESQQEGGPPFPEARVVREAGGLADAAASMHRQLMTGRRPSEGTLGRRNNPVEWKGVGPHGQGGEGMMGGQPYGRAMAMTGPDVRDGLQLDRVTVPLGPFVRWLPPGAQVDLVLQGDVVQQARLLDAPFRRRDEPEPFRRAERREVRLADLELARARHHLLTTADLLILHGLDGWAVGTTRLALSLRPEDEGAVRALASRLRRTLALRLGTRGAGVLEAGDLSGMGPVARASGRAEDARTDDPAYEDLGFSPVTHAAGDAEARWQQRLEEAAQALALAGRAGDRLRAPGPPVEGVRGTLAGPPAEAWRQRLEEGAAGQAFDAFATTLVSLDLDPAAIPPRENDDEEPA